MINFIVLAANELLTPCETTNLTRLFGSLGQDSKGRADDLDSEGKYSLTQRIEGV